MPHCLNPKALRVQLATRIEELGIEKFVVTTFDQRIYSIFPQDKLLDWTITYYKTMKDILTLTLPKNLTDLGIFQINIHFQSEFNVYVHQKGNLFTDMPDSRQLLSMDKIGYEVIGTIGHRTFAI